MVKRKGLMVPRLRKQVFAENQETAGRRATISKKNISTFFTHLYSTIFGGSIIKDPWEDGFSHDFYTFSPDIARLEDERKIFTEVKTTSTRASRIHSNLKQESNNLCEMLTRFDRKERPLPYLEYGLFRYGPRSMNNLQKLSGSRMVRTLAGSEKRLSIVPFNVMFFLSSLSEIEERDHTTSSYSRDVQQYHVIGGRVMTRLFENHSPLEDLDRRYMSEMADILGIGDVKVEHLESPRVKGFYRGDFLVEPFPITRYFLLPKAYEKVMKNMMENRKAIVENMGLRDLFEEYKKRRAEEKLELAKLPF